MPILTIMQVKTARPKTKRLVVLLAPLDHKRLGALARRAGISAAEFVRRAIADKVDGEKPNGEKLNA